MSAPNDPFDFFALDALRQSHPAWRLLRADNAPLIAAFLQRTFIAPNVRLMAQADLAEALEDLLFDLRRQLGEGAFPRTARAYLDDWAESDKGWLRKFYRQGSDEPWFDLTPASEKAIGWLASLSERSFVGAESRLLTLVELLRQMSEGSETDPALRIAELQRRREAIEAEMARIAAGDIPLLGDTELKDRFLQFSQIARELLADFRAVEQNFRGLDRKVRERIALWEGSRGELLEQILGERDAIADSDQGRNFRAFWDFLMSHRRQEELTSLLERVLLLSPVAELHPDARIRRIHYDWLEAGEQTQRTVALLSQQLRRFLDDRAWLENRRIMEILRGIESKALALRGAPPTGSEFMSIDDAACSIELPLERPLHRPAARIRLVETAVEAGSADLDAALLFSQVVVDRERIRANIRRELQAQAQITLAELCTRHPLQQGLAELVACLQIAEEEFHALPDELVCDTIVWQGCDADGQPLLKQAILPRVIFVR